MSTTTTTTTANAEPMTAETMLRLFPDIDTSSEALSGHDEEQIRLMDEVCIVLDTNDMPIGKASKKVCTCRGPPLLSLCPLLHRKRDGAEKKKQCYYPKPEFCSPLTRPPPRPPDAQH